MNSVACGRPRTATQAPAHRGRLPAIRSALVALAATATTLSLATAAEAPRPGDPARGKSFFQQNCAVCHASGADGPATTAGQGPQLAGVVGRPAASLPDFGYSKALQASHLTWDTATLDRFLTAPDAVVPGTTMALAVSAPQDRSDLIAYLAKLRPVSPPVERAQTAKTPGTSSPGDWQNDAPGAHHEINLADLPRPYATRSAGNSPRTVDRPADASPAVPAGFNVKLFTSDVSGPRLLRTAPNGDIFVAETRRGRIRILRAADGAEAPSQNEIFAEHLDGPFGIAFYPAGAEPQWVYVANLNSVVRFPYRNGDLQARGPAETIVPHLSDSTGGHTTRDIAFSVDGQKLFISVGSGSNVAEGMPAKSAEEIREWEKTHGRGATWGYETNRADILVTDPDGRQPLKPFATGIRNAVGLAVQPATGELWCSTNERDGLGDDLVPDYISRVREGGFYGWPWYYMGNHEDPRHAGARPDLAGVAIAPDVPVQPHSASLQLTFYPQDVSGPAAFPADYRGDIFAAFHGSWNRTGRTGSKVIRVHLRNGAPVGGYEDFLTGFVIDDSRVWGRPVGVTVARDGALIVSDDSNDTLWRIAPAAPATR